MVIEVLGTGCPNCKRLEGLVNEVVKQIGVESAFMEKFQAKMRLKSITKWNYKKGDLVNE